MGLLGKLFGLSLGTFLVANVVILSITQIMTNAFTSWDATSKFMMSTFLAIVIAFAVGILYLKEAGLHVEI